MKRFLKFVICICLMLAGLVLILACDRQSLGSTVIPGAVLLVGGLYLGAADPADMRR